MEDIKSKISKGYSICLNEWVLDKEIRNELGLLCMISSLSAVNGYCHASNKFFSELLDDHEVNISKKIKKLQEKGYINIEYKKNGSVISMRRIRLAKKLTANSENANGSDSENANGSVSENANDNNNNNKSKNNNSKSNSNNYSENFHFPQQKRFIKPTIEEIRQYCSERRNDIDAEYFFDYYESVGWMLNGGKKIKDWKACVRTWEKQKKEKKSAQKERKVELNAELAELKDIFCDYYKEKVGMTYNWGERESVSLIELAEKIRAEINGTDLKMNFEAVLFRLPDWYKQNGLDINIINKNFNNIKNKIKNGESTDYDYLMRKYSAGLQS